MRFAALALPALACLALAGCSDDGERARGCPDGEDPKYSVFDIGEDAKGASSPEGALASFLRFERSDLEVADFDAVNQDAHKAEFSHTEDGSRLARFYLERLDRGWFVISYEACSGVL